MLVSQVPYQRPVIILRHLLGKRFGNQAADVEGGVAWAIRRFVFEETS